MSLHTLAYPSLISLPPFHKSSHTHTLPLSPLSISMFLLHIRLHFFNFPCLHSTDLRALTHVPYLLLFISPARLSVHSFTHFPHLLFILPFPSLHALVYTLPLSPFHPPFHTCAYSFLTHAYSDFDNIPFLLSLCTRLHTSFTSPSFSSSRTLLHTRIYWLRLK